MSFHDVSKFRARLNYAYDRSQPGSGLGATNRTNSDCKNRQQLFRPRGVCGQGSAELSHRFELLASSPMHPSRTEHQIGVSASD
jgi:hypothetical protein